MSFLGEAIKKVRNDRGMSLQDVAGAAGITKAHVWGLEQGRVENPTIRCLFGLSTALGLDPTAMASLAMADIRPLKTRPEATRGDITEAPST
jgi:transcriptional regulator with XRE-family HTH domain